MGLNGIRNECIRASELGVVFTSPSNFNGTNCNMITFGSNCVCAGKNTPDDLKSCIGSSDQKKVLNEAGDSFIDDTSVYGMCVKHGGLDAYIDTRELQGKLATNEFYTFCELYLFQLYSCQSCEQWQDFYSQ